MSNIKRVGIVFSGGPAPGANAVISSAASSFLEAGIEVYGIFHGYSNLLGHRGPMEADVHYRAFNLDDVVGIRNQRGIVIGTARTNPGKPIKTSGDLSDPRKTDGLARVYDAIVGMGIDAWISIGGDDTLKTANLLYAYQRGLPEGVPRFKVVHVPKTIDNDYHGIDFTFGFFSAADVMAKEVLNLRADAMATSSYFIVETMGRKAGWLSYAVAIAGEANMVIGVEDLANGLLDDQGTLDVDAICDRIVDVIEERERRGKHFGTVVLAEGLAEYLPSRLLEGIGRDDHGHISLGKLDLGKWMAGAVGRRVLERTGRQRKITGVQLGYESRCAPPHAFDVMLGAQLGIGTYRALVEEHLDGHMVSVSGQLDLHYVPFAELVNPDTLVTQVRLIESGQDFQRLARFLETRTNDPRSWSPGPRREPPL